MSEEIRTEKPKYLQGKSDWLFLTNDTNRTIDQITGNLPLNETEINKWKNLFSRRKEEFLKRQIKYIYFVAPNKECVYPEFLPDPILISPHRAVNQLIDELGEDFFKYPLKQMLSHKPTWQLYSKGDSHWNGYGAFTAYQNLIKGLGLSPLEDIDVDFIEETKEGDLSKWIGETNKNITYKIRKPKAARTQNNNIANIGNYMLFENANKNLPRAVLFRDSFSTQLFSLLAENFSRLVAVWQPNIDYKIVDAEKPDFVISQQAERFLIRCPDDVNDPSHEQYVKQKLDALRS